MLNFKRQNRDLMSEINIIPFTDILLVILIAFMVMTPVLVQSAIKVNLPKARLSSPPTPEKKITITITRDSKVFVNDIPVTERKKIYSVLQDLKIEGKIVTVNADRDTAYGTVAQVLGAAQAAGALKLEMTIQNEPK
jgi:biopolymer transport protein TolR